MISQYLTQPPQKKFFGLSIREKSIQLIKVIDPIPRLKTILRSFNFGIDFLLNINVSKLYLHIRNKCFYQFYSIFNGV